MRPNPGTKSQEGHSSVLSMLYVCTENKEETAWDKMRLVDAMGEEKQHVCGWKLME